MPRRRPAWVRGHVCRRGLTLLEVVVVAAVILVISALVVPTVTAQKERQRVLDAADTFRELATAIWAFKANVGANPGTLRALSTPITTSGTNSCGAAYTTPQVALWAGPYYTAQEVEATGLPIASENFGRAQNALVRTPAGVATAGTLAITVLNVQLETVTELNELMDGAHAGSTTGRVRWTTPADAQGFVTLSYHVAIIGC